MVEPEDRLQVLIANERDDRLERISAIVEGLGHEIVATLGPTPAQEATLSPRHR